MKRFSIITVTWNNAKGLERTLLSVRNLAYKDWEMIVVDGNSDDNTASVMDANKDIITHSIREKDKGIYNAMNKGLGLATGDYVVFMNAGDCFAAADTLDIVARHNADIILGGAVYGGEVREMPSRMTLYDVLSIGINHQSTYYRRDVINRYGMDESYNIIADLKSVIEPMARDKATVESSSAILSICEGGGVSQTRWRDALAERKRMITETVDPYYRDDYARMARISPLIMDDIIVISHFRSVFPLIRCLAAALRWLNRRFKHIPI